MANVVKTFSFTGTFQSFVVPAQVTELVVECWGAWGGGGGSFAGGVNFASPPSYTKGSIVVTSGEVFYIYVGGDGYYQNGWNGGGAGGAAGGAAGNFPGGYGGGATDFRSGGNALSNRIMVAAGGGGQAGYSGPVPDYGGTTSDGTQYQNTGLGFGGYGQAGNGADGGEASDSSGNGVSGTQGKGATLSVGGAATVGTGTGATGGTAGASGVGGHGGTGSTAGGAGGGGGGGGYFGGSGGGGGDLWGSDNPQDESSGGGGGAGSTYVSGTSFTAISILGPTGSPTQESGYMDSGFCQISYVQPPTIPTPTIATANNTGASGEYDVTQPIEFAWQFASLAPGESQTRFDIQYSSNGGSTWTEISEPNNTSQTYTFPANFFTAATTYDVQVRVYDKEGVPSGWSASVVFEAVSLPGAPTITAPVAGSNITAETFTIAWTIPSGTQSDYWVQIYDAAGNVLIDTGTVASATESYSATLTFSEAENVTIAVRYQTTTSGGVWSTIATETVFLNLDPPATPVVNIGTDDDGGTISLAIINPSGSTVYNDIYRTDLTNNTPEIRIATNVPPNSTYTDYTPASGIYYSYRVRAYSASGGVADDAGVGFTGIDNTLTTFAGGATLSNGVYTIPENGSVTFWARINGSAQWTWKAQYYTSTESPYASFQPNGGSLQSSAYFADDRTTAVDNSANYTSNGNAQAVPLNTWTTIEWSYLGGPNVQWLKMTVSATATYTGGTLKIQNPVILNT